MKFQNAEKGIKKIFTAEILGLISSIGFIVMAVLGYLAIGNQADSLYIATAICGVATGILMLIGYILNIVGIVNASKDEESFKTSLYIAIFGIVFSFVSGFLGNAFADNAYLSRILGAIPDVVNLLIMIYIVMGIRNISKLLGNPVMEGKGQNIMRIVFIMAMIIFAARSLSELVNTNVSETIAVAMVVFAGILNIVTYVLYLSYLAKAKKMLAA